MAANPVGVTGHYMLEQSRMSDRPPHLFENPERLASPEGVQRKRVLLADDHCLFLDMMQNLIEPEFDVVGAVRDGSALVEMTDQLQPDIVLFDINMPLMNWLEAAAEIRHRCPDVRLLFITEDADTSLAARVFALGASALLLKQNRSLEVLEALRRIANGGLYLTPLIAGGDLAALPQCSEANRPLPLSERQTQVLSFLVKGLSMKAVARRLGISARTVAFHKYNAMSLLGLRGNADLIDFAMHTGLLR
jgi:DNA-binding NarL/FixJ family response regulator